MRRTVTLAASLVALLALGGVSTLDAQSPRPPQGPPADRGPGWGPGSMMGWGPGPMMGWGPGMMGDWDGRPGPMMGGRGGGRGMMMMGGPAHFIEGRVAFLRTELKITASQNPLFDAYADALRAAAAGMQAMHERMWSRDVPETLPERLQWHIEAMTSRLQAMEGVKKAALPLYEALSKEQREMADRLVGPMGMM